ncbi:DUF3017 domain-containing protein [Streptomyces sp. MBT56]|uniref:DUF3017 domain-containing protein n=1 Tax=unclassified Streptomyces TaxID=2593676 RepID=UPI00190CEED8|nr:MULTISPECIES: DUF3017 domain-containing protein [unclassified Streptomyces]MBK3557817.1 DUF3017 domain-containing protein [Streptomyces sp. MBT56]MBK3606474.1 DUF3017 domain-containing protein [Streptomyces sp. MBT54]MBK3619005.1 DUF3017 domain-containing protein [Streptomyces sp. MBT98]MBK6044057.1 DUF3017 domain-containing protein [Streptomyces sp. MBT55]
MGAGRSPADPAPAGETDGRSDRDEGASEAPTPAEAEAAEGQGDRDETAAEAADGQSGSGGPSGGSGGSAGSGESGGSAGQSDAALAGAAPAGRPRRSRRFPRFTRDTARPEGGGRAASGDAPAPARQWPLLTVLCAAGLGLLIVVLDPFDQAFRVGTILIGAALITGAVLRWVVPSVGMLAVRSRFTDLVTYGVMGTLIVLLALVAQPEPWLDVPILEDAVRFTIR